MKKYFFSALLALSILNLIPTLTWADCDSRTENLSFRTSINHLARVCNPRTTPLADCHDVRGGGYETAVRVSIVNAHCGENLSLTTCGCLQTMGCTTSNTFYSNLCLSNPNTPETQPARCGDGIVQTDRGEECELPYVGNCNEVCKWVESKCGDGRVDYGRGEECEPPATRHDGWECNEYCKVKKVPPAPKCGDGALNQASEECEPAGTATCSAECKTIQFCGDGLVQTDRGEECERPNTPGCDKFCKKIGQPEMPPPPTPNNNPNPCGNGILERDLGEQCEKAGVGFCSSTCQIINPDETPLVQQTLELLLEGSGMRCSLAVNVFQPNFWQGFTLLFLTLGALSVFRIKKDK